MTPDLIDETFFVAGGTLKATTPSYVKRPADDELFEAVMTGQLCYVLTPRQMGKSSLMTRTSRRLEENGFHTAIVDLTRIGTEDSVREWYATMISRLSRELNLGINAQEWLELKKGLTYVYIFSSFIEEIVLKRISERVVIFIDEIDSTLKLNFRDDFFAGLRAIHNARVDEPAFNRISFVLLGTASPYDLIADNNRTPFNVGRAITLQEFDFTSAKILQDGLDAIYSQQGEQILRSIFHWTNGHPYLTQKLCSEIVERKRESWTDTEIDQLVHELFLSEQARKETNLKFVQDRLLDNPRRSALLGLYQHILRGKVREDGQSALQNELKLSGLVRVEDDLLKVRNLIYSTVFDLKWVKANTPRNWAMIAAVSLAVLFFLSISVFTYDIAMGNLSRQYAGDVFTAHTAKDRLRSLSRLFQLRGVFTPNYDFLARESFYPLRPDQQMGLFTDSYITIEDKKMYLVPVIRGLYVTMANVSGGQDSTELLSAMRVSLQDVDSKEGRELQQEIDWWLQARQAGMNQKALDAYNQAIALEAENPSTRFERAQVELQLGQYELALADLDEVMALAQNISTEANEPTQTSGLISTETSAPIDITQALTPDNTETSVGTIAVTPQQTATPQPQPLLPPESGYISYQSSFFSIAYIRSAVSRLLEKIVNPDTGDVVMPDTFIVINNTSKYAHLISAGLLRSVTPAPTNENFCSSYYAGLPIYIIPTGVVQTLSFVNTSPQFVVRFMENSQIIAYVKVGATSNGSPTFTFANENCSVITPQQTTISSSSYGFSYNGYVIKLNLKENDFIFEVQPNKQATEVLTPIFIPKTPTHQPIIANVSLSEKDGMILHYVPAGSFIMGLDTNTGGSGEKPAHEVTLDAFWIDETEVTNRMYILCAAAGLCKHPFNSSSSTHPSYYDDPQYADFPVVHVFWKDAQAYCEWAGRALPSEAQWEKAARGSDGRLYPWGNNTPTADLLNFNGVIFDTTKVGSYPSGASPYGALDMAGNVWEWVDDWYDPGYYAVSPSINPLGPSTGDAHVLRGGSWNNAKASVRSTYRGSGLPGYINFDTGFRCALPAP